MTASFVAQSTVAASPTKLDAPSPMAVAAIVTKSRFPTLSLSLMAPQFSNARGGIPHCVADQLGAGASLWRRLVALHRPRGREMKLAWTRSERWPVRRHFRRRERRLRRLLGGLGPVVGNRPDGPTGVVIPVRTCSRPTSTLGGAAR